MNFPDCRAYIIDRLGWADEELLEIREGLEKLSAEETTIPITGKTKSGGLFSATFILKEPHGAAIGLELRIEKVLCFPIRKPPGD